MKYCGGITNNIFIKVHDLSPKNNFVISSQLDLGSEVGLGRQRERTLYILCTSGVKCTKFHLHRDGTGNNDITKKIKSSKLKSVCILSEVQLEVFSF